MKLFKILLNDENVEKLLREKDVQDLWHLPIKEVVEMGFKIERETK